MVSPELPLRIAPPALGLLKMLSVFFDPLICF
jgi:hypothetical protein